MALQQQLFGGEVQFCDANGAPYAGGTVWFYVPGTTTPKATYQDINGLVPNTNPVVLDAAGRARLWGTGQYRQVLEDSSGTLVWDQLVLAPQFLLGPGTSADGDVAIWSGTSGETLADSGVLLANLALLASTVGVLRLQVFTASGTYTKTAGMIAALVIVTGGGGGGAGTPGAGANNGASGGGGGGGGTSIALLQTSAVGTTETVTVGAAGTGGAAGNNAGTIGGISSFGAIMQANPGNGAPASAGGGQAGTGGSAGTGTQTFAGADGFSGIASTGLAINTIAGAGADSWWGGGGVGGRGNSDAQNGGTSPSPGGGGGGGASNNTATTAAGGNGGPGIVWVLEFCAGQTGA